MHELTHQKRRGKEMKEKKRKRDSNIKINVKYFCIVPMQIGRLVHLKRKNSLISLLKLIRFFCCCCCCILHALFACSPFSSLQFYGKCSLRNVRTISTLLFILHGLAFNRSFSCMSIAQMCGLQWNEKQKKWSTSKTF